MLRNARLASTTIMLLVREMCCSRLIYSKNRNAVSLQTSRDTVLGVLLNLYHMFRSKNIFV